VSTQGNQPVQENQHSTNKRSNNGFLNNASWLIPIAALVLMIIHLIWPALGIDAITLGLLILISLPWLSTLLENAQFPGGAGVTFRKIEAEQKQQRAEIEAIKLLIENLVTKNELNHLKELAGSSFVAQKGINFIAVSDFIAELKRLHLIKFIERASGGNYGFRALEDELNKYNEANIQLNRNSKDHFRWR